MSINHEGHSNCIEDNDSERWEKWKPPQFDWLPSNETSYSQSWTKNSIEMSTGFCYTSGTHSTVFKVEWRNWKILEYPNYSQILQFLFWLISLQIWRDLTSSISLWMVCSIGHREEESVGCFRFSWSIVSCIGLLTGIIITIASVNIFCTSSNGYGIDLQYTVNLSIPLSIDVEVLNHKCNGIIWYYFSYQELSFHWDSTKSMPPSHVDVN